MNLVCCFRCGTVYVEKYMKEEGYCANRECNGNYDGDSIKPLKEQIDGANSKADGEETIGPETYNVNHDK